MKVFVVFACIIVCVSANALPALVATTKLLSTGSSAQTRSQDAAGNYAFSYKEQHATGGSSRSEQGNPWGAVGSYSLNVGDGRQRVVKYVADGHGFRAAIATNEPGTAPKAPAAVSISAPHAVVAAPVAVAAAAPVAAYAAPAYAAPAAPAYAPAAPAYAAPAYAPAAPAYAAPALLAKPALAAVAYAPAVSAYSTAIDHAAPATYAKVAAPAHYGAAY